MPMTCRILYLNRKNWNKIDSGFHLWCKVKQAKDVHKEEDDDFLSAKK